MHAVYELRERLCEELEEYGKKRELSAGALDVVDKLAHTIKNLDKILECYEGGYSGYSNRQSYRDNGSSNRRMYSGRNSYNYDNGQSNSRITYSGNGYSRTGMVEKLTRLMDEAPDDRTREDIQNIIYRIDEM